jgi:hypothetical protein
MWENLDQGQSPNFNSRAIQNQSFKPTQSFEKSAYKTKSEVFISNYEPECKRLKLSFNSPGE